MLRSLLLIIFSFGVTLILIKQNRVYTQEYKVADISSVNKQHHKCLPQVLIILDMLIFSNVYAYKIDWKLHAQYI